jgi:hypothetical protein
VHIVAVTRFVEVITTRFDFLAKPNVQSARTRSAARGGTKPASHKTSPRDLPYRAFCSPRTDTIIVLLVTFRPAASCYK